MGGGVVVTLGGCRQIGAAGPVARQQETGMSDPASRACVPCRGGSPPLTPDQIAPLFSQLTGWTVVANHHIKKSYRFPDFVRALTFVHRIGALAEQQSHHPNLSLPWGPVTVTIPTRLDGLTESDFVLAAKLDSMWAGDGEGR
jgi:4a-hydroxytetrahydrobiopterin dehydratase